MTSKNVSSMRQRNVHDAGLAPSASSSPNVSSACDNVLPTEAASSASSEPDWNQISSTLKTLISPFIPAGYSCYSKYAQRFLALAQTITQELQPPCKNEQLDVALVKINEVYSIHKEPRDPVGKILLQFAWNLSKDPDFQLKVNLRRRGENGSSEPDAFIQGNALQVPLRIEVKTAKVVCSLLIPLKIFQITANEDWMINASGHKFGDADLHFIVGFSMFPTRASVVFSSINAIFGASRKYFKFRGALTKTGSMRVTPKKKTGAPHRL